MRRQTVRLRGDNLEKLLDIEFAGKEVAAVHYDGMSRLFREIVIEDAATNTEGLLWSENLMCPAGREPQQVAATPLQNSQTFEPSASLSQSFVGQIKRHRVFSHAY